MELTARLPQYLILFIGVYFLCGAITLVLPAVIMLCAVQTGGYLPEEQNRKAPDDGPGARNKAGAEESKS